MSTLDFKQACLKGLGQGAIKFNQDEEVAEKTLNVLRRLCDDIKEVVGQENVKCTENVNIWRSLKIEIQIGHFDFFAVTINNIRDGYPLAVTFENALFKQKVVNSQEELVRVLCDYMSDASVGKRFYELMQWIEPRTRENKHRAVVDDKLKDEL